MNTYSNKASRTFSVSSVHLLAISGSSSSSSSSSSSRSRSSSSSSSRSSGSSRSSSSSLNSACNIKTPFAKSDFGSAKAPVKVNVL